MEPIPPVAPHLLVEHLGERLREAIGERLHHDGLVIVVLLSVPLGDRVGAEAGRHREGPDRLG